MFNAGDIVFVPITATDTASGTLTFSANGLPSGLTVNVSTGLITGVIGSVVAPGVSTTTLTVCDGTNTAVDTFTWTLAGVSPVVITNPGDQSSTEGNTVELTLSASDTGSGTLRYAASRLPAGRR